MPGSRRGANSPTLSDTSEDSQSYTSSSGSEDLENSDSESLDSFSDEEEFAELSDHNDSNIQSSAVQVLAQIDGGKITQEFIEANLHTVRLVAPTEEMHHYICSYVGNSQAHDFGIKILDILRIVRKNEHDEFHDNVATHGKMRMMLWHGTRTEYVASILQHGFQCPALSKKQMFGAGIYFADRASKSANYCNKDHDPGSLGYMFLCDVLLGKMFEAVNPDETLITAPENCDSLTCIGKFIPDPDPGAQEEVNGSLIPLGKTVPNSTYTRYTVMYNEFVVYSNTNVKPMYLVKFEFTEDKVEY